MGVNPLENPASQNRYISNSGDRIMSFRDAAQYGQNYRARLQYDHTFRSDFRKGNFRRMKIIWVKILEVDIEVTTKAKALEEIEV